MPGMMRRWHKASRARASAGPSLGALLVAAVLLPSLTRPPVEVVGPRILRDGYGVPHIYAFTVGDLFRGWGQAVAEDRLWQLEVTRASVWGRVAELYGPGPDNQYADYDVAVRQVYVPADQVAAEIQALPAEYRSLLEAYAAGINRTVKTALADPQHRLPFEFHEFGVTPREWTVADVAQVWMGTMALRYGDTSSELDHAALYAQLVALHGPVAGAEMFDDLLPLEVPDSPVTCPGGASPGRSAVAQSRSVGSHAAGALPDGVVEVARRASARQALVASVLAELGLPTSLGSQMWMAGGSRTGGDLGLLVGGPQMGFTVPAYLHEVGLHGAGFDLVGTTAPGYPAVLFGYNKAMAWSATSGLGNGVDLFMLELVGDDYHYLHGGQVLAMEHRTEIVEVRGGSPVTVDLYRSLYGPVFDWQDGIAYTRQRAWDGLGLQSWAAWLDMNRAIDFAGFSQAASAVALSVNWGYADRHDIVGYLHCGRYPIRSDGIDVRLPTAGDGSLDWQGYLPFSWNPQCQAPAQGYLANWNNRPAAGYPLGDLTAGYRWNSYHRVVAIDEALAARPDLTFADMLTVNREVGLLHGEAAYFAPLWIAWLGADLEPRLAEAAARLSAWGKAYADADADGLYDDPALTIWNAWQAGTVDAAFLDEFGSLAAPDTAFANLLLHVFQGDQSAVPLSRDYLNGVSAEQVLRESLQAVLVQLQNRYGTPDMGQWLTAVEPHTFQAANYAGIPQALIPVPALHLKMNRGSENHIVGLRPDKIKAVSVNPPGQSGFVAPDGTPSSHYADQMGLFEDFGGYKPMPLRQVGPD